MRVRDYLRTSAFLQSLTFAGFFALSSLIVFAFIFWQTVDYASREIDHEISQTAFALGHVPPFYVDRRLKRWLSEEIRMERYGLLLDVSGGKVAGNIDTMPDDVRFDGYARSYHTKGRDADPDHRDEIVRGVATKLADGRLLFVGVDTDEWEYFRTAVLRALALGLIPTIAFGCLGGVYFGRRTIGRLASMDASIDRIMHGDLSERLPHTKAGRSDELDRLAKRVNLMLDDIQRLLLGLQVVGDGIAHELRTPLTRMRTRLENGKLKAANAGELRALLDEATMWLDQTLGVITAVLRIGEIEHGRRSAEFETFDAARVAAEVHDLMEPLAEENGLRLGLKVEGDNLLIDGDRELIIEALVNLVDNAIKYTPSGGECSIGLSRTASGPVFRVQDSGPGIAESERQSVLQRFYRSSAQQGHEGSGLGLALVAAVARLHHFEMWIGGNRPGCVVELRVSANGGGQGRASLERLPGQTARDFELSPSTLG